MVNDMASIVRTAEAEAVAPAREDAPPRKAATSIRFLGEPCLWTLGGALGLGIIMILGFLALVLWNGIITFIPKPVAVVTLADGARIAGEPFREETYRPQPELLSSLSPAWRDKVAANGGVLHRILYRTGNYDLYGEDFRWVSEETVAKVEYPKDMLFVERREWGPFVGTLVSVARDGVPLPVASIDDPAFAAAHDDVRRRTEQIREIERGEIGRINHELEGGRLQLRKLALEKALDSPEYRAASDAFAARSAALEAEHERLARKAGELRRENARITVTLADVNGVARTFPLHQLVRAYAANDLSFVEKVHVYVSRWWEFLSDEPREANTEGGVLPAIFGTAALTLLLVLVVTPFGVMTALYLREYAKQGRLVSAVRICVNNLAGVPSIVYGVFGLGFFAYVLGARIDALFYAERLPNPTFGTGGLLWASLTMALLTVPVVIVATEEALAAVPRSMREGSLACGASKWQTIRHIVLPRAMPGIMTGVILAMARGAGEVAPLMLVGVVKLAPELPIDGYFPFIHLERSFMHLGFHIYDVGFQSRNSEAGKPMVFVTTMLLISLIAVMNITAIMVRNRLKRKFAGSQF